MDIGIAIKDFWNYSLNEINDLIGSYNRKEEKKNKEQAIFYGILANQIGEQIAILFDDKHDIEPKQLWDYYPTIFGNEKLQFEEQERQKQLELHKIKMKDYMYRHNRKNGGVK